MDSNKFFSDNVMMSLQPYTFLFVDFIKRYYKEELDTFENLRDVADISMPDEWFPEAR